MCREEYVLVVTGRQLVLTCTDIAGIIGAVALYPYIEVIRRTTGAETIENTKLLQIGHVDNAACLEIATWLKCHRQRIVPGAIALGCVASRRSVRVVAAIRCLRIVTTGLIQC